MKKISWILPCMLLGIVLILTNGCKKDSSTSAAGKKKLKYEVSNSPSARVSYKQADGNTIYRNADSWEIEFDVSNGFEYYLSASENTGLFTNLEVNVYLDNNQIAHRTNAGYSCSATVSGTASW
jgi:hypothetical protein